MGWLAFNRLENGKHQYVEGALTIEFDETGLLTVFKNAEVVHVKQFQSKIKAMLGVEPIYHKYKTLNQ